MNAERRQPLFQVWGLSSSILFHNVCMILRNRWYDPHHRKAFGAIWIGTSWPWIGMKTCNARFGPHQLAVAPRTFALDSCHNVCHAQMCPPLLLVHTMSSSASATARNPNPLTYTRKYTPVLESGASHIPVAHPWRDVSSSRVNNFPFQATARFHRQLALDLRRHFHTPMPAAALNINVRQLDRNYNNNDTSNLRVLTIQQHMPLHAPPPPPRRPFRNASSLFLMEQLCLFLYYLLWEATFSNEHEMLTN